MLDREEKTRNKPQRPEKCEEEKGEQLKAAIKPKEVVNSVKSLQCKKPCFYWCYAVHTTGVLVRYYQFLHCFCKILLEFDIV